MNQEYAVFGLKFDEARPICECWLIAIIVGVNALIIHEAFDLIMNALLARVLLATATSEDDWRDYELQYENVYR